MKCNGCEAKGEYGCRAGFTSIVINGEMGCEDADRALAASRAKDKVGMTVYPSRKDNKRRPISRADNIRAMTDKELADFVNDLWYGLVLGEESPGMCDVCNSEGVSACRECWLDWLRQEADT